MILSVIFLSMLMIILSTLYSEFKSYLQDTVDRDRKLLLGFDTGKTQRFSFDWSNTSGAI